MSPLSHAGWFSRTNSSTKRLKTAGCSKYAEWPGLGDGHKTCLRNAGRNALHGGWWSQYVFFSNHKQGGNIVLNNWRYVGVQAHQRWNEIRRNVLIQS